MIKKIVQSLACLYCCIISASGFSQITTASNGLTATTSTNVALGGSLTDAQTAIDFGSTNSNSNFLIKKGTKKYLSIANNGSVTLGDVYPNAPDEHVIYFMGGSYAGRGIKFVNTWSGSIVRMHSFNNGLYVTKDDGAAGMMIAENFGNPSDGSTLRATLGRWEINSGIFTVNQMWTGSGQYEMTIGDAARKGIIVKSAASQTGNLQEWQNNSGTALALITAAGKIGIGTNSPWAKLDVRTAGASGSDHEALNIQNPSSANYATVSMTLGSGSTSFSSINAQRNNNGNGSTLYFQTTDNNGTIQPRMFINDAGSVGIGTQGFPAKFTIYSPNTSDGMWIAGPNNKNVALLTSTTIGSWNALSQIGDNLLMWKGSDVDHADAGGLAIGPWSNSAKGIRIGSNGDVGVGIGTARSKFDIWGGDLYVTGNDVNGTALVTSHGGIAYYGNNTYTNGLAITPTGEIGIGTSAPGPYKLAVAGTIGARKIKVTLADPWADFVFEKDYNLPTLPEVEQFIQKNKHLPGVPSAKEVEKNGLDIGGTQAILLQKIEELTLYVIQQQKEIEWLKARIK
jgi:hypothetical protein